jgi:transposase-like protein
LEVVKLSLEDKESIKELAIRFEVSENTIYNWRSKYLKDGDSSFPGKGNKMITDQDTTIAAFNKVVKNRPVLPGLVFHSDRGSQYASKDFRKLLATEQCIQSMSRKSNCWDNAVAESFFKTIKCEELYRHQFKSIGKVYSVLFDYIDGWYNTKRIHFSLKRKSLFCSQLERLLDFTILVSILVANSRLWLPLNYLN